MKAARLHEFKKPLIIEEIDLPKIRDDEGVLIRIAGAGVCHTDLHISKGEEELGLKLPLILGHENAGYIYETGSNVENFKKGDPVIVYGAWGCKNCEFCRRGEENLCDEMRGPGLSEFQGGYAEFMYVPSYRYLIKVDEDPTFLAPLTDAGLTSYRAVKKARNFLKPGDFALILGIGGLGMFGLSYAKILGNSYLIAADVIDEKLKISENLGADFTVNTKHIESAIKEIMRITNKKGCRVILDFVGSDSTIKLALECLSKEGIYIVVGVGGGRIRDFLASNLLSEAIITGNIWGSYNELVEVYNIYKAKKLRLEGLIKIRRLEEINEVFEEMNRGSLIGRVVLKP
ncbi:MAG TPA: NAD(P)-dependent alcohol dehydrogenase [Geobacterales bacterium]|nr:NAD(P)-dependent alcohol dehydrogenase [Geobacterales bacterium]